MGSNHVHIRLYVPPPAARKSKFICVDCGELVNPAKTVWTTREHHWPPRLDRLSKPPKAVLPSR